MLKKGDKVTISILGTIANPLNRYEPFKPSVSLCRPVNGTEDLKEMEDDLRGIFRQALQLVVEESIEASELLSKVESYEQLTDVLRRRGHEQVTVETESEDDKTTSTTPPRRIRKRT